MSLDPLAVGDIIEVKHACYCRDQLALNVLHIKFSAVSTPPPTYAKLAEDLEAALSAEIIAALSAEAEYLGCSIRNVWPLPLGGEIISTLDAAVGAIAGHVLPLQVTGMVTKRTNRPGRAHRGRMYVPFPGEASSEDDGRPTAAYRALLATIGVALTAVIPVVAMGAGNVGNYIVFQRAAAQESSYITAYTSQPKFATQRRRGSYGRPNARPF